MSVKRNTQSYLAYYQKLDKVAMLRKVTAVMPLLVDIIGDKPIGLLKQTDLEASLAVTRYVHLGSRLNGVLCSTKFSQSSKFVFNCFNHPVLAESVAMGMPVAGVRISAQTSLRSVCTWIALRPWWPESARHGCK